MFMDKELIAYCKENNYVYVDYTSKFKEVNDNTLELLNEILIRRREYPKYDKFVYRIDMEKIDERIKCTIFKKIEIEYKTTECSIYLNKNGQIMLDKDVEFTKLNVNSFLSNKKDTCSICLNS